MIIVSEMNYNPCEINWENSEKLGSDRGYRGGGGGLWQGVVGDRERQHVISCSVCETSDHA